MHLGPLTISWSRKEHSLDSLKPYAPRMSFGDSRDVTLGRSSILEFDMQPDCNIRPQRLTTNAPSAGIFYISVFKVRNVSIFIGPGDEDAFHYHPWSIGQSVDCPELTPTDHAILLIRYNGVIPVNWSRGEVYTFTVSLKGPAKVFE